MSPLLQHCQGCHMDAERADLRIRMENGLVHTLMNTARESFEIEEDLKKITDWEELPEAVVIDWIPQGVQQIIETIEVLDEDFSSQVNIDNFTWKEFGMALRLIVEEGVKASKDAQSFKNYWKGFYGF